jgi:DNA repair protein RecO (recombination protein O)
MTVVTEAFILHRFAYQEADLILKVLTRDHGMISVLAKGVRRSKTKTQGCFEPFVPIEITYFGQSDLKKLKAAEMRGDFFSLHGECLYAAFYLNELLIFLVPASFSSGSSSGFSLDLIFDHYEKALGQLAGFSEEAQSGTKALEVILREFEIALLLSLGVWPDLSRDERGDAIHSESFYELRVEHLPKKIKQGFSPENPVFSGAFRGEVLLGLASQQWQMPGVLSAAKKLLRHWISFYCEGKTFKSRECFAALQ